MSSISSSFGRVPNLLRSQIIQGNLTGTTADLFKTQEQLSTLLRVSRPSDDPLASALISTLDFRLERGEQLERNLNHGRSILDTLDQSIGHLSESVLEAKTIASSQVGVGSDAETRRSQAIVVDSILKQVVTTLNRSQSGLYYFGGGKTGSAPIEAFHGGYRYIGRGDGLHTDLGAEVDFPITIGADEAVGALSARVKGDVDLNATLVGATKVSDFRGPAEGKLPLGSLEVTIDNGGPLVTVLVDLSQAETASDINDAIESAILTADPAALTGGFGTNLGFAGERFSIGNVAAGYTITFADGPAGSTATALGLDNFNYDNANAVSANPGVDLDPKVSSSTTFAALNPATAIDFGDVVIRNGGRVGTVTVTPGLTIGEFIESVKRLDLGVRAEIDASGQSLNIVNEVSGFLLSVEEGGNLTATTLGIRTLKDTTSLSVLNHGRGVQISDGNVNPQSGLPDVARNLDFEITLTDGSTFTVDLTPADTGTIADVIAKINAEAVAQGFGGVFTASLGTGANGLVFSDTAGGGGTVSVTSLNGYAAEDLGLLNGTFTAGAPATFAGSDPGTVRVDSILSTLTDLRVALETDDERGITFAGGRLETEVERIATARALVGGRSARLQSAQTRLDDMRLLDESIRSELRDLDFISASSQFSLLQTQLQAGMISAASLQNLSLLNFLT